MEAPLFTRATDVSRMMCFLLCIPSGGVLLAHIYGLLPMHTGGWAFALPCCVLLAGAALWGDKFGRADVAEEIAVGAMAGLVGTILYDLARIPVLMMGRLVFAPIELYGVWLLNATVSSRFTEVTGWLYHFSNGITFGIMYALLMRGRHWIWAVAWAFVLETIFVVSPLANSVALFADWWAVGIAYSGHVAYGLGLGWLVQRWSYSTAQLCLLQPAHRWMLAAIPVVLCAGYVWNFGPIERDRRTQPGTARWEGHRLNPDFTRLTASTAFQIENQGPSDIAVRLPQVRETLAVKRGETISYRFPPPARVFDIYQVFVISPERSRSSFVIVEPAP